MRGASSPASVAMRQRSMRVFHFGSSLYFVTRQPQVLATFVG
jgi:hypothetical protein